MASGVPRTHALTALSDGMLSAARSRGSDMATAKEGVPREYPRAIATGCYSMHSARLDRFVIYDNATGKNLSRERPRISEAWQDAFNLMVERKLRH
jgi:hypothetical protein